jgi:hypothetical protein
MQNLLPLFVNGFGYQNLPPERLDGHICKYLIANVTPTSYVVATVVIVSLDYGNPRI